MTPNKEDYLKCIYELGQKDTKMTNKQIASNMQVSAPSVSEMLKKLISEDLIEKHKSLGYALTATGQQLVAELYRKHRLLEVFLVHHLHYTADEIHEEAEVLEHTVSDTFIDRLEELLDFPEVCPHGGSIPKKGQLLVEKYQKRLSDISQPATYALVRIQDVYPLLQYLEQNELTIGSSFEWIQVDHFAETVEIAHKDRTLTIPKTIAHQLYVEPISS